jgi:proteic killer suppression protein
MIKTFGDKQTKELFETGKHRKLRADLFRRAIRRLEYIHLAICLEDLKNPPSNRLHALKGNRQGQYAVSINDQWRIYFCFIDGDAYDVEITDYH